VKKGPTLAKSNPQGWGTLGRKTWEARLGHDHDTDLSFPRGRPHRELSFRRRRSLSLIISLISAAGRISIVPHFNFTPGDWEMS
jgi:hypothetical protein